MECAQAAVGEARHTAAAADAAAAAARASADAVERAAGELSEAHSAQVCHQRVRAERAERALAELEARLAEELARAQEERERMHQAPNVAPSAQVFNYQRIAFEQEVGECLKEDAYRRMPIGECL